MFYTLPALRMGFTKLGEEIGPRRQPFAAFRIGDDPGPTRAAWR